MQMAKQTVPIGVLQRERELRKHCEEMVTKRTLTPEEQNFVKWLQETLIPDLRESRMEETANDFAECVRIMQRMEPGE
jgi:hypothetical protein